ncbi:hypothetical protein N9997_02540 [Synechococcus sp. AH-603-L18]|nr:hypothetical protein [Synechococcus sp. AH-603-L18]MDB4338202.1 hypothetical protein [Synechococcus sp. AH-603-L18]
MNFKRLSLVAVQAIGLGLMPAAALADITDTTTFTGTVPGSCTYASGTSQTVEMSYSATDSGTFTGTTGNIGINCNYAASVSLGAVTANGSNPATTTNTAKLNQSGDPIATSGEGASSTVSLGNTNGVTENVTIDLTATGASETGDYSYTVVLTTLSS